MDMADLELDRSRTAVICMDVQNFTVRGLPDDRKKPLLTTIRRVLDGARDGGVTVIYIASGRRPDFSSPRNKFTSAVGRNRAPGTPAEEADRIAIVAEIAPVGDEPIVRKPRMNAFYGSELQTLLTARDIDTVALCGVATNFVVESTARYAVDCDYRVILLEDCCTSAEEEAHTRAVASMEPLVHIVSSEDFLAGIHWR
jgi:nicotinamidase-related amidase